VTVAVACALPLVTVIVDVALFWLMSLEQYTIVSSPFESVVPVELVRVVLPTGPMISPGDVIENDTVAPETGFPFESVHRGVIPPRVTLFRGMLLDKVGIVMFATGLAAWAISDAATRSRIGKIKRVAIVDRLLLSQIRLKK
jgi:hypothetical protein